MAPFICCGVRRHPSPDIGPIQLVDNSRIHRRFPLTETNSPSETSASSTQGAAEINQIFEAAANEDAQATTSQAETTAKRHPNSIVKRKESTKKIQDVASRVRKTISRDSGISKHSSKRNLRSSMSHEEIERRRELKRALHGRVQSDLVEDKIDSDGEYDEDAIPMKTPRSTWGREAAFNEINPRRLSKALKGSLSTVPPSHSELDRRDISQTHASRSVTGALSRMLTVRGSQATANSNDNEYQNRDTDTENAKPTRTRAAKKYIFRDESPEKLQIKSPETRTPSPLERSNTVIRNPSSTTLVELGPPEFLNTLSAPCSPELLPQRLDSISDSVAGREWRLSYAPSRGASVRPQFLGTIASDEIDDTNEETHGHQAEAGSAYEAWSRGVSGLFRGPVYQRRIQDDSAQYGYSQSEHRGKCNPAHEEKDFGGVDGNDGDWSKGEGEFLKMPGVYKRKPSSGSAGSVHLYSMRIPQALASKTLLTTISQPFLQQFALTDDDGPTNDYNFGNGKPRRRVSGSGFNSARVPRAWHLPKKYAASSVYSQDSTCITPMESHQTSLMFLNKIADRMNRFETDTPGQDVISVPAANSKHVDLDRLEHRTLNTSLHSSNESLTNCELATAKARILPRATTFTQPKSSWFKEDFDDVSVEIARTNPQRRSLSERRSLSNYDGNSDRGLPIRPLGFSFVPGGEEAGASVWDKALQEHEQEDAIISHTRLGSETLLARRRSFRGKISTNEKHGPSHRHLIDRLSPNHHQEDNLQAHLGAYQLPTYTPSTRRRTPTDELNTVSTPSSVGSWTRYPSHDRELRSSASAGEVDNIFARDFAEEAATSAKMPSQATGIDPTASIHAARLFPRDGSSRDSRGRKKSKSMTFGRNVMAKLHHIYRVGSLEFASRTAYGSHGHRSSISEGERSYDFISANVAYEIVLTIECVQVEQSSTQNSKC